MGNNPNYSQVSPRPSSGSESASDRPGETENTGDPPAKRGTASNTGMPMRTASWPGLPGKSGPERSAGVTKVKTNPRSEGI